VLQILSIVCWVDDTAGDVGIVPLGIHRQQSTEMDFGIFAGVTGFGGQTTAKTLPGTMESVR
jgi:hypothetical protein